MPPTLAFKPKVMSHDYTQPCAVCGQPIDCDNWYLEVRIDGERHPPIHDNESCPSMLKVKYGLAKPNFYTSRIQMA